MISSHEQLFHKEDENESGSDGSDVEFLDSTDELQLQGKQEIIEIETANLDGDTYSQQLMNVFNEPVAIIPDHVVKTQDDSCIKKMTISSLKNTPFDPDQISTRTTPRRRQDKYYICPTNTIVASDGNVYQIEPFRIPPPSEIAAVFKEFGDNRRERGLSNLGIMSEYKKLPNRSPSNRDRSSPKTFPLDNPNSVSPVSLLGGSGLTRRRLGYEKPYEIFGSDNISQSGSTHNVLPRDWVLPPHKLAGKLEAESVSVQENVHDRKNMDQKLKADSDLSSSTRSDSNGEPFGKIVFEYRKFSLCRYLQSELFGSSVGDPSSSEESAVRSINNSLSVPLSVEKLIWLGFFICVDSFLYSITYLPIRFCWSIFILLIKIADVFSGHQNSIPSRLVIHRSHVFDIFRGVLIFIGCFFLQQLNMSYVYHYIRGQNMIKLYVLTGMLEVFDKLLCSFGQDAHDSFYYHIRDFKYERSDPKQLGLLAGYFFLLVGYVIVHSLLYFATAIALNVAVWSSDNALISVIILNNFTEIKAHVFKKFDKNNLFQLACADITERFKLFLFMFIISMVEAGNSGNESIAVSIGLVFNMIFCEAVADWIKHAFVTKFNQIDSSVYKDYARIFQNDIINGYKGRLMLEPTYAMSRKVGLSQVPLVCVSFRYMYLMVSTPMSARYLANFSLCQKLFFFYYVLHNIGSTESGCRHKFGILRGIGL